MIITSEMLMSMKRPLSEYEKIHFNRAFPNGMELTAYNLEKAKASNLDIMWFIARKLPENCQKKFMQQQHILEI